MKRWQRAIPAAAECAARRWRSVLQRIWSSFSAIGISSLLWLLVRSGSRPTRFLYPCQRAAAANVQAWVGLSLLGLLVRLRNKASSLFSSSRLVPVVLAAAAFALLGLVVGKTFDRSTAARLRGLQQTADRMTEILSPSSSIFVVKNGGGPDGLRHEGVDRLINLMGVHDFCLYRTEKKGIACSPAGLIGADDVVLIKVNCQWDQRGGTNTDVLKGLIYRITQHPDGFTGEIVVADNGQDVGIGGSLDWPNSNAEDHSQSAQDVVNLFSPSHKVSTYLWTDIRNQVVDEFDQGDMTDGYVLAPTPDPHSNFRVSYPKFTTPYGTRISLKRGIYTPTKTGGTYDKDRLKVINVPVLKSHSGFGMTACVKHYMGVQSQPLSNGHNRMSQGAMGTLFADLGPPVLNILDAIWVNANPRGTSGNGPSTSYAQATRLDTLMASTDPIALDAWAANNVYVPAIHDAGYSDPNLAAFWDYLRNSKNILLAAGYPVTSDSKRITVFKAENEAPVLTDAAIEESGSITLRWLEIAPGPFVYTVEQSDDLQSGWEPVPGNAWPISAAEWSSQYSIPPGKRFFRVRRDPAHR